MPFKNLVLALLFLNAAFCRGQEVPKIKFESSVQENPYAALLGINDENTLIIVATVREPVIIVNKTTYIIVRGDGTISRYFADKRNVVNPPEVAVTETDKQKILEALKGIDGLSQKKLNKRAKGMFITDGWVYVLDVYKGRQSLGFIADVPEILVEHKAGDYREQQKFLAIFRELSIYLSHP